MSEGKGRLIGMQKDGRRARSDSKNKLPECSGDKTVITQASHVVTDRTTDWA